MEITPGTAIIHTSREFDDSALPPGEWLCFANPVESLSAQEPGAVQAVLERVERALGEGLWAAGFVSYEAAPALDPSLRVRPGKILGLPLCWFGLYEEPRGLWSLSEFGPAGGYSLSPWELSLDREAFDDRIERIKEYIARGDTYQVNFTYPLTARFAGDPGALFLALERAQGALCGAFVHTGRHAVASASPELFFAQSGADLVARPMKGTSPRGRWPGEDERLAVALAASAKDRAENVMIVDLLRNDLGRVALSGSIGVENLFRVERYGTVLQMTSTVRARTPEGPVTVLRQLFPCGSVTGAPKVRTMQIIAELESAPRGVYTGAVGWLGPTRRARFNRLAWFNVAIRTVALDLARGEALYGVGGGITWGSVAAEEWEETWVKARLLSEPADEFELLETLLWEPEGGYFLLERHLARLAGSAGYFGRPCEVEKVREVLLKAAAGFEAGRQRVRLRVDLKGDLRVESALLADGSAMPLRVGLALKPVDTSDRFLFHKTTRRNVYEAARQARPELEEIILWNARDELTEGTIFNLVLELEPGSFFTPALECGLLAGTFRAELLACGEIAERVLTKEDLIKAKSVWLINSVRRWVRAEVVEL